MENASKALILAGAVLIAILVISLGVLIFNNLSASSKNSLDIEKEEISHFNSALTPYVGDSVSGSQVNALLQYCLSNNMSAENSGESYKTINVTVDGVNVLKAESFDRVPTGSGKYYKVNGIYDDNGLLTTIEITKNY